LAHFISRNFTSDHFPNGPQTIEDKILLFVDRVRGWQLHPAQQCIHNDPHAGFAVLHIVTSYFEVIGMIEFDPIAHAYLKNAKGKWERGKEFKAGLMSVLPELRQLHAGHPKQAKHVRWFRNEFYKKIRCGLYHQSMTRSGIFVSGDLLHPNGYAFIDLKAQGSAICINPRGLAERLNDHLSTLELRLRDPVNQQLRKKFEQVYAQLH
jgi:hypothetical protein